ncbi:DUF664 domain-containing protein [Nocardioides sp. 503]|uniref:mycothiol transferase n=1 Tax=Nocardioides sp. 503 TaxID=2508326 RepID=UPI001ADB53DB|nr:DUF664 domain-containing protein [Nocardioides sp. 503]
MTTSDPKATLVDYLQQAREAIVWKLEGLGEYDARRPLTPTGTGRRTSPGSSAPPAQPGETRPTVHKLRPSRDVDQNKNVF